MQQRYISHLLERLTISILPFNIPYINTLWTKLMMVITIPWFIDIMTFEDQHTKPVKDLKLIFNYFFPDWREEELVNLRPPVGK